MESFKNFFKNTRQIIFISLIVIVIFTIAFFSTFEKKETNFSIAQKIDAHYLSWVEFQRMSSQNLVNLWVEDYFFCEYKLGGNSKENKYDCFSAIYFLLKDLGSNLELQSTAELDKQLKKISIKRKNIKQVKEKDLITIFVKNAWHVGMVVRTYKNKVYYIDVNVADNGFGYKNLDFNSNIIKGIYPICFKLWIGDLLDEYIEIDKIK